MRKNIFFTLIISLFVLTSAQGMDVDSKELSPVELHTKLCVLNQTWHRNKFGLPFGAQIEAQDKPFNLQKINEPTEASMTPLVWAMGSWQTDDKVFLAYLIQQGADINNPQIICSALNWGRFKLVPWLVEKGAPFSELKGNMGLKSIFIAMILTLHNNLFAIEQSACSHKKDPRESMNQMISECIAVMELFHSKGFSLDQQDWNSRTPLRLAADQGLVGVTQFFLDKNVSLFYGKKQTKRVVDYLKTAKPSELLCIADRDACIRLIEQKDTPKPSAETQPTVLQRLSNLLITK